MELGGVRKNSNKYLLTSENYPKINLNTSFPIFRYVIA